MSSKPRRLAVLAVAGTLAAATGTAAQAAPAASSSAQQPAAHWVVVPAAGSAVKPPPSVTALARDLGVDTGFAWRTLDELAKPGRAPSRGQR
jgi:pyruvate/2-oxoglutarate dehydrogenase complex dihydrolipoamide acyltransferase (E2) component